MAEIDKNKVYKLMLKDYSNAKNSKTQIDATIAEWNEAYDGSKKNDKTKKSLVKEVAKVIEMQKPNITEPFLSTAHPARVSGTGNPLQSQKIEDWLNSSFVSSFDRETFIDDLVDISLREGTCWVRTGWNFVERKVKQTGVFSMDELINSDIVPTSVEDLGNNLFKVQYISNITEKNCPDVRVCRNENCFPDNTARTIEEMNFFVEKSYKTYYDIVNMGIFKMKDLLILKQKISSGINNGSYDKSSLEQARDDDALNYGVDTSRTSNELERKKFSLMEYWGYVDLYNNGKPLAVVGYWIHELEHLIDVIDSPMPSKKIPYDKVNYSKRSTSLWGNSVAFFLGENQNVKNGIVRGILDNLALANNGQKFIQKSALDLGEFVKLKNKARYIMVNKPDGISDGQYNQIPSTVFNVLDMVNNETDQMTGISMALPAMKQSNVAKQDDNGLTMSQQKMASFVRKVSGLLSRVFREWLSMAEVFLDDQQIEELLTDGIEDSSPMRDVNLFKNSSKSKILVTVSTDVSKMMKLQQLNMLMQQTKSLGDNGIPPDSIKALVCEMYDLFDMHDEASRLRTFEPKPTPEQMQMQQMQMQKMMLDLQLVQAQINEVNSKANKHYVSANVEQQNVGIAQQKQDSDSGLKLAQSTKAFTQAEKDKIDSSLRPGEAMMDMQEKIRKIQMGDRTNDGQ